MSQIPFGPEDLKEPPLEGKAFLDFLHAERARILPNPPAFYQALYDGQLRKEDLQLWSKDLYYYWDYGIRYSTGAIFVKDNDEASRTHLLKRLVDIEGKDVVRDLTGSTIPSYEELWLRFGEGLGLSRDDILNWKTFTRTYYGVTTLCLYSRWWEWTWLDGIASIYAADLHHGEYLARAQQAIKRHFDLPQESLELFHVVLQDVADNMPWEEEALAYWCCTTERQLTAARALRERLMIEEQLLVSVDRARSQDWAPLQVP